MRENRTPQREPAANRRLKKPPKIAKSLNATFSSICEDELQTVSKESIDFSPISDVSDITRIQDIDTSLLQVVTPALSASCESSLFSDHSTSSVVTVDKKELYKLPVKFGGSNDLDKVSAGSVEADIAVNFFKRAQTQVLQSTDVDHQSKKLLDASLRIIIDNFHSIPKERDQIVQLISAKNHILFLCLLLWIIVLSLISYGSEVESSFRGPLPT